MKHRPPRREPTRTNRIPFALRGAYLALPLAVFAQACSLRAPNRTPAPKAAASDCVAVLKAARGDLRIRRAADTTWKEVLPPVRLCVDDRVFAGVMAAGQIVYDGRDETNVRVSAGSIFVVGREPPLSSRVGKIGQPAMTAAGGDGMGGGVKGDDALGGGNITGGLELEVFVREHRFSTPRGNVRAVVRGFPSEIAFQLTSDYLAEQKGRDSRGVLWQLGLLGRTRTVWSRSGSERVWRVPVTQPGRYVFQVFSENTRDRTSAVLVDVVDGSGAKREVAAFLPATLSSGELVVIP